MFREFSLSYPSLFHPSLLVSTDKSKDLILQRDQRKSWWEAKMKPTTHHWL